MKKILFTLFVIGCIANINAQTPITDANFKTAINTCLSTNPVDGMCSDSEYGAMPDWDVSNVTDMSRAFIDKSNFNADISSWDVSSVTNMDRMFQNAGAFNQDIGSWDVSSVTDMSIMFFNASSFNQDITDWCVSNIMSRPIYFSTNSILTEVNTPNWGFCTTIRDTYFQKAINTCLSTNPVDGMCSDSEYGAMPDWDVSNVTDMANAFQSKSNFNADISSWDVSSVTNMDRMFQNAGAFNQDIGSWDVSSVTNMERMFQNAGAFNQDIGSWDVSRVTYMGGMFNDAGAFNQDISSWCVFNISSEPAFFGIPFFSNNSPLTDDNKPIWGTCPNLPDTLIPITDDNFNQAVNYCLSTNPVDGLRSDSPYGAMPDWDVSNVTDMANAFQNKSTFNADISSWDVSNVTDMTSMFYNAESFNQDISSWDVSSVTNMRSMFSDAGAFNQDIGSWDVSSVTDMSIMLNSSGLSVENYDTLLAGWSLLILQQGINFSNANLRYCLSGEARQNIIDTYGWTITDAGIAPQCYNSDDTIPINDTNFKVAINSCLYTNPVDGMCSNSPYGAMPDWDVSNVTDMSNAFNGRNDFNADISAWDVSNVVSMFRMFENVILFNQDLTAWDVSSVTNMWDMFKNASSFNQDIGSWDVSNVETMWAMFAYATSFNQNIGDWDVSNVTNMRDVFWDASAFNQDLSSWDVSSVNDMSYMFYKASSFNQDIGSWVVRNVNSMQSMFNRATSFNQDISSWDVSNVTDMEAMFAYASSFSQDIRSWDVSNVTVMGNMFLEATSFNQDISNWCVNNISSEPTNFSLNSPLTEENKPIWGTCPALGVDDQKLTNISIYPNPVKDKLFIQGLSGVSEISIYDVLGKLVLAKTTSSEIEVSNLKKGIYTIKIVAEQKETIQKFIKN